MRRLLPPPVEEVDPYEAYRPEERTAPLLRVNMVTSADGAVTDERGASGGLGGEGDRRLFGTLRALADGILVGAGTVRVDRYGAHRPDEDLAARRRAEGRPETAPIIVVTRSLDLDFGSRLFTEARSPTIVLTGTEAPAERRRAAERAGVVILAGQREVDLPTGVRLLREQLGLRHLLCEGGPTLNAPLFSAGLVDELCLTLAPSVIGRPGPRILGGLDRRLELRLMAVCEQDDELYLRYRVARGGATIRGLSRNAYVTKSGRQAGRRPRGRR
jgi:riboflavin-specific deaminase-like protein